MPREGFRIEVHGIRELSRGLKQLDEEVFRDFKDELQKLGDTVRRDATKRFSEFNRFSAQGFKTRVRPSSLTSTITIEQNLKKTSGNHPEWGSLQMTEALIPARRAAFPEEYRKLEGMVDRVLRHHNFL